MEERGTNFLPAEACLPRPDPPPHFENHSAPSNSNSPQPISVNSQASNNATSDVEIPPFSLFVTQEVVSNYTVPTPDGTMVPTIPPTSIVVETPFPAPIVDAQVSDSELPSPTITNSDSRNTLPVDLESAGIGQRKQSLPLKISRSLVNIFSFSSSSTTGELPKVAIKKGFRGNWSKFAPHLLAVGVTGGVVQLSFRNVYWMDLQSPEKNISPGLTQGGALNFLQLAAKLHELLILLSITSIVLHLVQNHLTQNGLPLGMISNPFELASGQFLRRKFYWSSLWEAMTKPKQFTFKLFWLVSLVSTLVVLLAGPSSAISVIPALGYFEVEAPLNFSHTLGPFYTWNHSMELWPSKITSANLPSADTGILCNVTDNGQGYAYCPIGGLNDIESWAGGLWAHDSHAGFNFTTTDGLGQGKRVVAVQSCNAPNGVPFNGHASGVTINAFLSVAITSYWNYAKSHFNGTLLETSRPRIFLKTKTFAPRVETICETYINDNFTGENPDIQSDMFFPTLEDPVPIPVPDWAYKFAHPLNISNLTFVEISNRSPFNTPLGAVLSLPGMSGPNADAIPHQISVNLACSIYSQWVPVDVWYEPNTGIGDVSYSAAPGMSGSCLPQDHNEDSGKEAMNVAIGIEYANAINQPSTNPLTLEEDRYVWRLLREWERDGTNDTGVPGSVIFNYPMLGLDPNSEVISNAEYNTGLSKFISTFITGIVTDALARIDSNGVYPDTPPMFLLSERDSNGNLQGRLLGYGDRPGYVLELNTTNLEDSAQWLRLDMEFQRYGYGYRWHHNPTTQFGISVLLIHTTGAVIYIIYLLGFLSRNRQGGFPKTWETIPELFLLAANSKKSEMFENTSAGIKETSTWAVPVAVREMDGLRLEIVAGKEEMNDEPRARVGVAYG